MADTGRSPFVDAHTVRTRPEFERFVLALRADLLANRHEWENDRLENFLGALAAWTHDMDGSFENRDEATPEPSWSLFAEILTAAALYE